MALASVAGALLASGLPALPVEAANHGSLPDKQELAHVSGKTAQIRSQKRLDETQKRAWKKSPSVTWPKPGTSAVDLPQAADRQAAQSTPGKQASKVRAGTLPVRLAVGTRPSPKRGTAAPASTAPVQAKVTIRDRKAAARAGIDGVLLSVERTDAATGRAPIDVELDYTGFRNAYGGGWGSRLQFVALPACALTNPAAPKCQTRTPVVTHNDAATGTVKAQIQLPATTEGTTGTPVVLAATAGAQGAKGDYRATSLSASGSWQGGGSSGGFSWSYPMEVPSSLGGPGPALALSYSSASVDGRTSASSQQASWVGDGWDLGSNFVERTFVPCANDRKKDGYNNPEQPTGDLCQGPPMVTMSLNGTSTQLVLDDESKKWRLASDDGSKVELVSDTIDGAARQYWRVTTTQGLQYHFGMNLLPQWTAGKAGTNSAWKVPVYGNHPQEDCHKTSYADSVCNQVWRWNLDYVVDPRGNAMTYWYQKESNYYGSNVQKDGKSTNRGYDRGGWLDHIDYGLRSTDLFTAAPSRVSFSVGERCVKTDAFDCGEDKLTPEADWEVARNWPDVPADQLCAKDKDCKDRYSPTFFSRKQLTAVTTEVLKSGKHEPVDTWKLTQNFPPTGDGGVDGDYPLWLAKIQHTGKNGTGSTPVTMPAVTFTGKQLPNRVDDNTDGNPPYLRWRVEQIHTETGGVIGVEYMPTECSAKTDPKKLPASPETNTMRCYPVVVESADPTDPTGLKRVYSTDWFHKHVVTKVGEQDKSDLSTAKEVAYEYVGKPAWAWDDDSEVLSEKARTWNQWRGYQKVRTLQGVAPDKRSLVENVYYRGMHGDRLPSATGGKRAVQITDSEGGTTEDLEQYAGQVRETLYYNGEDGPLESATLYTPGRQGPTATRKRTDGAEPLEAWVNTPAKAASRTILSGSRGQRRTAVEHTYGSYGLVKETTDRGDLAKSDDDTCTRYEYLTGSVTWMPALQTRVETLAKACDAASVSRPADVVSDIRVHYDDKGNVIKGESLSSYEGSTPKYTLTGEVKVDAYGRPASVTDVYGHTTTTAYSPAADSIPTKITTTNVLGHSSAVELDPGRGLVLAEEDTNKRRSVMQYDALGRLTKTWSPDRDPATTIPDAEFGYDVRSDGRPTVITNKKLLENGTYRTSYDLYDGMLRLIQTQQKALDGGRVVTDTFYNSRGLVWKENGAYYNKLAPEPELFDANDNEVPSSTRTDYDGMGRPVATISRKLGAETWRTTTTYGGDWIAVDPPQGDTPTKSLLDAQGRKTQLQQFKGASPTGVFDAINYRYDRKGRLESVTDQGGNTWTYKYDLRGRPYETTDPDKGTTTTLYDKGDRALTVTNNDKTIAFAYDALGRVTATHDTSLDGTKLTEQTYDTLPGAIGLPVSSTRYIDGAAYTQAVTGYDTEYRPTGTQITIPAREGKLAGTYAYTNYYSKTVGQPIAQTQPAAGGLPQERVTTGYNGLDQVTTMSVAGKTFVASTEYSPLGDLLRTRVGPAGQQLISSHEFDEQTRRPTRTVHDQETGTTSTTRISDTTTAYDPTGNILKIKDAQGPNPTAATTDTQCFAYDYQRRMTEAWTATDDCAAKPGSTEPSIGPKVGGPDPYWTSYTFDAVGNRKTERQHNTAGDTTKDVLRTYTYETGGTTTSRLSSVGTSGPEGQRTDTYQYDGAGNTTKRVVMGTTHDLTWDIEGHLKSVTQADKTTEYVYDASGNRLIRRDPAGTTLYLPGTEVRLDKSTATLKGTRYYEHPAGPVMVRTAEAGKITTTYLLSDRNGTATTAVDATTKVVTRRKFTPYGEPRGAKPSLWPGEKGFVGGTIDQSTGLTHLGAREYDPALGRFISVDPLMDTADSMALHPYTYAGNSPITFSDPSGLRLADCAVSVCAPPGNSGGGGSNGHSGGGGSNGHSGGGTTSAGPPPAPPTRTVSESDVKRASWVQTQRPLDIALQVAKQVLKDVSGYDDIKACLSGKLVTCGKLAAEAALPWAGKAKRVVKALSRAWSAYNKWDDEVRWATGVMRRAEADAKAMARYAEDYADWKKQADAAKAAKKAEEAKAAAAKKTGDSGESSPGSGGSGGAASCNSFTPSTQVLMADGTTKSIKDIKPGDKVIATDPETGETEAKVVSASIIGKGEKHLVKVTIDTDGPKGTQTSTVTATDGHPFWVPELREWLRTDRLHAGTWLQTDSGTHVKITAVQPWTAISTTVHNLTVTDIHTYYVLAGETPVLVHNSNGKGCGVGGSGISARNENAGDIGNYTDGQGTRDPASQWYHEELSNDELLDSINKAGEGDGILVSRDGTILGGHHRKDELLTRIKDGRIDPNTQIRIDVYDGD
ncbi:RHS repeat-associated core domain-containing protein [Streptomyces leeuwenhoekii]|uniref:RHS repeat-associated core domain-containing protein n=1 Tax=Streptomyces leeuwenhoekii TaxID=1437453 RepID=UPI00368BBB6F